MYDCSRLNEESETTGAGLAWNCTLDVLAAVQLLVETDKHEAEDGCRNDSNKCSGAVDGHGSD